MGAKARARSLLLAGSLGLALAAFAAALVGARAVLDPQPEVCPLPALPVPREIRDFSWSQDSRRLIAVAVNGEVRIVRFPELKAEKLPPFSQMVTRTGFDRSGTPWLVYLRGLARLRADGRGWDRFVAEAGLTSAPGGRWQAHVRPPVPSTRRKRGTPPILVLREDRPAGRQIEAPLPSGYGYAYRLAWMDTETLLLSRTGMWRPTPLAYSLPSGQLAELCPIPPGSPGQPDVQYEFRSDLGEAIHSWLVEHKVPGVRYRPFWDCRICVSGPGGQALLRVPVGRRRHPGPGRGDYWQAAKLSPDAKFVVLRAADDSLRVMDLHSPTAR